MLPLIAIVIGYFYYLSTVVEFSPPIDVATSPIPTEITMSEPNQSTDSAVVARVVDGDTLKLADGQTVRLIGIDTPETVDPRRGVQCFGQEASDKAKELLTDQVIRLEKDVSETDRYQRLLRYVYVDELFINLYLVEQGYARASSYPPDVKYQQLFKQAEQNARQNSLGLWGSCPID